MKKLSILLLIITLYSCSKDSPANEIVQQSATGSVEFKVNGNPVVMKNVDLLTGQFALFYKYLKGTLPETRYHLNAQNGVNNFLVLTILSDSLQIKNYHYDSIAVFGNPSLAAIALLLNYNGQSATVFYSGDYVDINISSYKEGRISGTFTGKITPYSTVGFGQPGATLITEGKINNVSVIY